MTTHTPEDVSELIRYHDGAANVLEKDSVFHKIHVETASALRELQRHRAENRWVPWNTADDLPSGDCMYWCAVADYSVSPVSDKKQWFTSYRSCTTDEFDYWLIAYWSQPLPPPYVSNASEEGR
jgi:hypothetical protein